jgi:hypothetical protein
MAPVGLLRLDYLVFLIRSRSGLFCLDGLLTGPDMLQRLANYSTAKSKTILTQNNIPYSLLIIISNSHCLSPSVCLLFFHFIRRKMALSASNPEKIYVCSYQMSILCAYRTSIRSVHVYVRTLSSICVRPNLLVAYYMDTKLHCPTEGEWLRFSSIQG